MTANSESEPDQGIGKEHIERLWEIIHKTPESIADYFLEIDPHRRPKQLEQTMEFLLVLCFFEYIDLKTQLTIMTNICAFYNHLSSEKKNPYLWPISIVLQSLHSTHPEQESIIFAVAKTIWTSSCNRKLQEGMSFEACIKQMRDYSYECSLQPVMVILSPPLLPSGKSAVSAAELFHSVTIQWKNSLSNLFQDEGCVEEGDNNNNNNNNNNHNNNHNDDDDEDEDEDKQSYTFPSISFEETTIPTLLPSTTPTTLKDGTLFFSGPIEYLYYALSQCLYTEPTANAKKFIQAQYPEVLRLVEKASRTDKGIQWDLLHKIVDHWFELGVALFVHALQLNQYTLKEIVGLFRFSMNQLKCYLTLVSTNLVPVDEMMEWLMPNIMAIESKDVADAMIRMFSKQALIELKRGRLHCSTNLRFFCRQTCYVNESKQILEWKEE